MPEKTAREEVEFAAWVGIDWAQEAHEVRLQACGSDRVESLTLAQDPEAIRQWARQLGRRFGGRPVAVCLETPRGALMHALMGYDFLHFYPVNPRSFSRFREAFRVSGAKDDPGDADLLLELVRKHPKRLHRWEPADPLTRSLQLLTPLRRSLVDERKGCVQKLTSLLRSYFPQALRWAPPLHSPAACALLRRWPSLQKLQKASLDQLRGFDERHKGRRAQGLQERFEEIALAQPLTQDPALLLAGPLQARLLAEQIQALSRAIERVEKHIRRLFKKHPDSEIFSSFPGAGDALAPRLAAAFGTDRSRFATAQDIQKLSGIAPVTRKSGNTYKVCRRLACCKFQLQTQQEFAGCSIPKSRWAKAFYQQQLKSGKSHNEAVRALAFRWQRIQFACWKNRVPYSEERYYQALKKRNSPLVQFLQ